MNWTDDDLRSLYRRVTAPAAAGREHCLDPEAMARLAALDPDDPDRLAAVDHLGACSACAREYRAATQLGAWVERAAGTQAQPHGGGAAAGGARGRGWPGRVLALAALVVVSVALAIALAAERRAGAGRVARLAADLAARETDLAEARREAAGATDRNAGMLADLRRTVGMLSQPQANVPIVDLVPAGVLRGSQGAPATRVDFPRGTDRVTLVLTVTGGRQHDAYALRLEDASGGLVWRGEGLERSPHGTFALSLPRATTAPGDCTLRLVGARSGREETVEIYALRVRHLD